MKEAFREKRLGFASTRATAGISCCTWLVLVLGSYIMIASTS